MSDLKRLDEALTFWESVDIPTIGDLTPLVDAARAYRDLLANGEREEWCETHNAESIEKHGGTTDECWRVVWVPHDEPEGVGNGYSLCRIVPKLLVDPTTEEER